MKKSFTYKILSEGVPENGRLHTILNQRKERLSNLRNYLREKIILQTNLQLILNSASSSSPETAVSVDWNDGKRVKDR